MTDENVRIVQDAYAAYGKGDFDGVLGMMTPDVSWESIGQPHDFPTFGDVHRGHSALRGVMEKISQSVEFAEFVPDQFFPSGDRVFVLGHFRGEMRSERRPVATKFVQIFTLKNGKISAYEEYQDTAAVGRAHRGA